MVLININALSDSEIRYIAEQEELENWETLSREELIEELEDLYGEDLNDKNSNSPKYIQTLTTSSSDVLDLPGVSPLPNYYNETFIHFATISPHWAYAFWYFSALKFEELKNSNASITIRITAKTKSIEKNYDLSVSLDDNSWSIELPWGGMTYSLSLIATVDGKSEILAKSNSIYREKPFIESHKEILNNNDSYKLLVSSMVTKNGQLVDCSAVQRIINDKEVNV